MITYVEAKVKIALVTLGCFLGATIFWGVWRLYPELFWSAAIPEGAKFESLDDLRQKLTEHDARDNRPGGNVSLRTLVQPHPLDSVIYELRPNFSARFQNAIIHTNSFGMRGPEISLEKPDHTYRIAILGDSYAFGWGVEDQDVFSRRLEDSLNKDARDGANFQVLNFGVPGYATFQEVGAFLAKGKDFNPDAVIVYMISNDFGLPFFIRGLNTGPSLLPAPEFHKMKIDRSETERLNQRNQLLRSLDANRPLNELGRYCRQHEIKLSLVIHPDGSTGKMLSQLWITKPRAGQDRIDVLDIASDVNQAIERGDVPEATLRLAHDHHPGPGLHQIIGQVLAQKIGLDVHPSGL